MKLNELIQETKRQLLKEYLKLKNLSNQKIF